MKTLIIFNYCLLVVVLFYTNTLRASEEDFMNEIIKNLMQQVNPFQFFYEKINEPLQPDDVKFYLYTKNNPEIAQELQINNEDSVNNSYFNKSQQTKIIIHDWLGSYTSLPNGPLREAYLSQDGYNIISIDWNDAKNVSYYPPNKKVQLVGKKVAELVDFLNEKFELSFDSLVVIGYGLGAHVAGFCGKCVKRDKLSYIVALDPTSYLYNFEDIDSRLDSSDAKFVETIQTIVRHRGLPVPFGTAVFYANWGYQQPECKGKEREECSHRRSIILYANAIQGYSFYPIYKCSNFKNILQKINCSEIAKDVKIGDPTEIKHQGGIYNFKTSEKESYGHF